jgi:hypothetical protein
MSLSVSQAVCTLENDHEEPATILWREVAYSQRQYYWQARFSQVVEHILHGPLEEWEDNKRYISAMNRWFAASRLLQTDLALRRFHEERGTLPKMLAELVPAYLQELPVDPFSHRELIYRPHGSTFTLYSIGRDRCDDGGKFGNLKAYNYTDGYDFDLDTLTRPDTK